VKLTRAALTVDHFRPRRNEKAAVTCRAVSAPDFLSADFAHPAQQFFCRAGISRDPTKLNLS
jgi:hypothetical protein